MAKGEFKNKRVHELLDAINYWFEKRKRDLLTQEALIEHIEKRYPSVKLSKKSPHLSAIPPEITDEILIAFVGKTPEPYKDLRKHIYLRFPHRGSFSISADPKNKLPEDKRLALGSRLWIKIITSPAGTTDLINYEKQMLFTWKFWNEDKQIFEKKSLYKLEDYAKSCKELYHAKELNFEQFKAAAQGNRVLLEDKVPEIGGKPVDFTEGLTSADGKG